MFSVPNSKTSCTSARWLTRIRMTEKSTNTFIKRYLYSSRDTWLTNEVINHEKMEIWTFNLQLCDETYIGRTNKTMRGLRISWRASGWISPFRSAASACRADSRRERELPLWRWGMLWLRLSCDEIPEHLQTTMKQMFNFNPFRFALVCHPRNLYFSPSYHKLASNCWIFGCETNWKCQKFYPTWNLSDLSLSIDVTFNTFFCLRSIAISSLFSFMTSPSW